MLDIQCFLGGHDEEHLVPDMAGLDMGEMYDHHADHGLDEWLAHLLPLSSTFTGHLEGAKALYDGSNHNLIGVRNFLSGTPQLAVLLGMTRANDVDTSVHPEMSMGSLPATKPV